MILLILLSIAHADMTKATEETWKQVITAEAKTCGLCPAMVESIIRVESTYCLYTKNSTSTAKGCMQLLKGTAKEDYSKLENHRDSIRLGVAYLCKLKQSFKNTYVVRFHAGNGKLEKLENLVVPYLNKLDPSKNKYFTASSEYDKLKLNLSQIYKERAK